MNIGALRNIVKLQRRTAGRDALGQPLTTWTDVATVYADIRYLRGLEAIKAGAESSVTQASIRIRWRTDVTPDMRVLYGSTAYQIKAVLPDMAKRAHVDLAVEVVR
jgi:SPP1 family predicted phage head-tail adaptor